jgi:peptidase M1-like protein
LFSHAESDYTRFMRALAAFLGFCSLLIPAEVWADAGTQKEPHEIYEGLNLLRVDPDATFAVDAPSRISLNRGDVRLAFEEGRIAFLKSYPGLATGVVFAGRGHVLALPRSVVEKQQMARFTGAPLLDQEFTSAFLRFTDNTGEELLHQLQAAKTSPERDAAFASRWDGLLAASNPGQSLRILYDLISQNPRPYFYAWIELLGNAPLDIVVDPLREESLMIGQGKKFGDRTFYDVWASYKLPEFPAPKPAFRALRYTIETTILPDNSLEGSTEVRLTAETNGERLAIFQLSRMLNVDEVIDEHGDRLAYFQNEGLNPQERNTRGNDYLYVVLPAFSQRGQESTLRFRYRGSVIEDAGNGVLFVGARETWYPHYGNTADFADYDLTMRWPRRFRLVATGTKLDEHDEGDFHVTHWKTEKPASLAGFNLGEYASASFSAGARSIELYANRQLEQALGARLGAPAVDIAPSRLPPLLGPEGRARSNVMMVTPPPSPSDALKELGREIDSSIRFYESFSGPFPFRKLNVSQIPGSFGQGWPGLLYISTFSFLPPATQQRAGLSRKSQELFTELVPFHEVAHQWWGNLVGWGSYRDQWIDEAIANYLALLFADTQKTVDHSLRVWLTRYRQQLLEKPIGVEQAGEIGSLDLGTRLNSSKSPNGFEQVIYPKGSWVIHMIREMLRQPGAKNPDARFVALLHTLATKYAYRALSTPDLQREIEAVMTPDMDLEGGHSMEWFFEEWVRGTGVPHYHVTFTVHHDENGYSVRGKLFQSGVPRSFIAPVPLYASTSAARPALAAIVATEGPETSFHFTTQVEPHKILIDPQMTLLCTTN